MDKTSVTSGRIKKQVHCRMGLRRFHALVKREAEPPVPRLALHRRRNAADLDDQRRGILVVPNLVAEAEDEALGKLPVNDLPCSHA